MAKRDKALGKRKKTHSHKTKKRLAAKRLMLEKKKKPKSKGSRNSSKLKKSS
jgi:hypothetical protein